MKMRVESEILAPGVKDGEETDLGTQMLGVGGNRLQGLGCGVEQNIVHRGLVLEGDCGDLFWHGKDDVEILGFEDLGLPVFQPLGASQGLAFWACALTARVVGDPLIAAIVALLNVTAERGRPALFDRGHGGTLRPGQCRPVLFSIGIAVAAEYIRHLRSRKVHGGSEVRRYLVWRPQGNQMWQQVQRTGRRTDMAGGDAQILSRGGEASMAEQQLNGAKISARFEEMDGKGMSQRMWRNQLIEA